MADRIKGITVEIGGDTTKLSDALNTAVDSFSFSSQHPSFSIIRKVVHSQNQSRFAVWCNP